MSESKKCGSCEVCGDMSDKKLNIADPLPLEDWRLAADPMDKDMNGKVFEVHQKINQGGREYCYIANKEYYGGNAITVVPSNWLVDP